MKPLQERFCLWLRMDMSEYLRCIVCRELKANPQESRCCHKLYCLDCIQSMTNTRVCSICQQESGFSENTFASRLINIMLGDDSMAQMFNVMFRYLSPMNLNFDSNRPDTELPNAFRVTIITLENKKINIIVEKSDTVRILKLKFQQKDGTAPEHQRLIFQGKQLQDDRPISHYKIEKDSVIHFVKRYNGS